MTRIIEERVAEGFNSLRGLGRLLPRPGVPLRDGTIKKPSSSRNGKR